MRHSAGSIPFSDAGLLAQQAQKPEGFLMTFFLVFIRICHSKKQFFDKKQFSFKHSTSDKWSFSKAEVSTCVDKTVCECWWINVICLRRLNFSLSSHVYYLHFYRCADFTCLFDKEIEMLKNSFSLFMFKNKLLSCSVRFRDFKQLMLFE